MGTVGVDRSSVFLLGIVLVFRPARFFALLILLDFGSCTQVFTPPTPQTCHKNASSFLALSLRLPSVAFATGIAGLLG